MAVKGAVLGDILGSKYEWWRPKNLDWKNVELFSPDEAIYTDDTVMILAIKKAILNGTGLADTMVEVGRKYLGCGYGEAFYQWLTSDEHRPYNSWGNGSAMRVAFIGEYYEDYCEMQKMAEESAAVTHNHPEGIKGAVVTATCIWMAKHGKTKKEIYEYVLSEYSMEGYPFSIGHSLSEIRADYRFDISCQGSVPVAMRCFYESEDYESFIRNIYSLDCDSDTLGAIAGGVAEEYYHGFGNVDADGIIKYCLSEELLELVNLPADMSE